MERKLEYSFDDEIASKFCYDMDNKIIEVYFTGYSDEKERFLDKSCIFSISNWTEAKCKIGDDAKLYDIDKAIGIFKKLKTSNVIADLINEINSRTQQVNQQLNKLYQDLDKELEIATPYLYSTSHSLVCGFKSHNPKLYDAYWYHPDHLGSSSFITNTTGEISQHMEYLPFGETLVEEHLNSHNSPFKFNAKEYDAETGNYYYGARYYDPKWSMWLSVDPLVEAYPG